jgi:two-component system LytT family response regulator
MIPAAPGRALRVLIVDDETLARRRISDMLRRQPDVEIVGAIDDGGVAADAIRELRPDVVFLDYEMPGRNGLDVVRDVGVEAMPVTIFVTAHREHAVAAFELAAVDYLVKPFDDERFVKALERARRMIRLDTVDRLRDQLLTMLQSDTRQVSAPRTTRPAGASFLQRIAVESKGRIRVVPVAQIDFITASGVYAELHVGDRRYIVRESLQTFEERLDPDVFARVHRSAIVRLDLVDVLVRASGGNYEIHLKNGARLRVSRSRKEALERQLGVG